MIIGFFCKGLFVGFYLCNYGMILLEVVWGKTNAANARIGPELTTAQPRRIVSPMILGFTSSLPPRVTQTYGMGLWCDTNVQWTMVYFRL